MSTHKPTSSNIIIQDLLALAAEYRRNAEMIAPMSYMHQRFWNSFAGVLERCTQIYESGDCVCLKTVESDIENGSDTIENKEAVTAEA